MKRRMTIGLARKPPTIVGYSIVLQPGATRKFVEILARRNDFIDVFQKEVR